MKKYIIVFVLIIILAITLLFVWWFISDYDYTPISNMPANNNHLNFGPIPGSLENLPGYGYVQKIKLIQSLLPQPLDPGHLVELNLQSQINGHHIS